MDYQEAVDEAEDQYEDAQDMQDAQLDQYSTFSQQKQINDLYSWFWKVVRLDDPFYQVKVANLNKAEIGEHGISVRDAMNLGHLGKIFGHSTFGNYWENRANITSASSMAKSGWFMEMSIIQKKIRERAKKSFEGGDKKWRMFGQKKNKMSNEGAQ